MQLKESIPLENLCHIYRPQSTQLVVSINRGTNVTNVAPYNIAVPLDHETILLGPRAWNDTDRNVRENGEFSINVATHNMIRQVVLSAQKLPPDRSEFDLLRQEGVPLQQYVPKRFANDVSVPGIQESPLRIWCKLQTEKTRDLPEQFGTRSLLIGKIIGVDSDASAMGTLSEDTLLYAGCGEFASAIRLMTRTKSELCLRDNPLQIPQIMPIITAGHKDVAIDTAPVIFEATKYPPSFIIGLNPHGDIYKIIEQTKEFAMSMLTNTGTAGFLSQECIRELSLANKTKHLRTPVLDESPIHFWCNVSDGALDTALEINPNLVLFPAQLQQLLASPDAIQIKKAPSSTLFRLSPNIKPLLSNGVGDLFYSSSERTTPFSTTEDYLQWLQSMRFVPPRPIH